MVWNGLAFSLPGRYNLQRNHLLEVIMRKTCFAFILSMALVLLLTGCGKARSADSDTPAAEPQATADVQAPAETETPTVPSATAAPENAPSATAEPENTPSATAAPEATPARQDGERFETVIMLEGMEEPVQYEHIINRTAGFEMDYDYESFARRSEAERERFVSVYDNAENPENYLDVTRSTEDPDTAAASIGKALSEEYDILVSSYTRDDGVNCTQIDASIIKGSNNMAEHLQIVYIIPASNGCCIATAHCYIADSEGFLRRLSYMVNTISAVD